MGDSFLFYLFIHYLMRYGALTRTIWETITGSRADPGTETGDVTDHNPSILSLARDWSKHVT